MLEVRQAQAGGGGINRDRAIRLFQFLRELAELKTKARRTLSDGDQAVWFADLPRDANCACAAWPETNRGSSSSAWLEVRRPSVPPPPDPGDRLSPWVHPGALADSSGAPPELAREVAFATTDPDGSARTEIRHLEDHLEVEVAWLDYLEQRWAPWAELHRRKTAVQRAYADLFSMYQRQQRLGEAYEAVLGLGFLSWRTPSGHEVGRHLVTAPAVLKFDPERGTITVGPPDDGALLALEQDMLDPEDRPDAAEQRALEAILANAEGRLWDADGAEAALRAWVNATSTAGVFDPAMERPTRAATDPRVHLAPAVVLRRRNERGLVRVFEDIAERLRAGDDLPVGVERLVAVVDDAPGGPGTHGGAGEIFFPLPANDAQREIVRKLGSRQGVLVQGPPGTGKSHTIVNLVTHLLASGKRVLVTSHTARALEVLRDKFPREVRDLCVLHLGDDHRARQDLESSVAGITRRFDASDPPSDRREAERLARALDDARRAEARLSGELRALREAETRHHPAFAGGYGGTAQAIAARLRAEEPGLGWLKLDGSPAPGPPLTDEEALELLALLRSTSPEAEAELGRRVPPSVRLPEARAVADWLAREDRLASEAAAVVTGARHGAYPAIAAVGPEARDAVSTALVELIRRIDEAGRVREGWASRALIDILSDRADSWAGLLEFTERHLREIGDRAVAASELTVTGTDGRAVDAVLADASALLAHLEAGGGLGWGPVRPKPVKDALYLVRSARAGGRACDSAPALRDLVSWADVHSRLDLLDRAWDGLSAPPSGTPPRRNAHYEGLTRDLRRVLEADAALRACRDAVRAARLPEPRWDEPEDLEALRTALAAARLAAELEDARRPAAALAGELARFFQTPGAHAVTSRLLGALRQRDVPAYAAGREDIVRLEEAAARARRRGKLLSALRAALPELARELETSPHDARLEERLGGLGAAWRWAVADAWLRALVDPEAQRRLEGRLDRCRASIRELLTNLAALLAWEHTLRRMTERERQKLVEWKQAVRRGGKFTGIHANTHRKAARAALEEARSAIPAWVMPVYRVAESFRPGTRTFDVAIVDEASQSGPEALFLSHIADKVVVVGDDRQIKPESVGLDRGAVELLRQRHIPDLPATNTIGSADTSYFEIAEMLFGGRIRLREHFRCMPEIIQFSNNLCYADDPLVPLKQFGAGRLEPVVATAHVPDGYQRGTGSRSVNPPEAEAIADAVARLCADPRYDGKTVGVISLLGEEQARLVESLLIQRVGPEEMERRSLVCGDAYAFQGDERDVMFLSLVSAPGDGRRIPALTDQRAERRFNVAASRAREQMWLFHTATLDDLNPQCLRFQLLEYCRSPHVEQPPVDERSVDELARIAATADRRDAPPGPFDSWFELDVFLEVARRGFRVIPQVEVNGYRIDLVVEGMRGRLAVECDGDAWHGPERYEQDAARQRELERAGWSFWRVRGSAFYRDPRASLESLWITLANHGIRAGAGPPEATEPPRPEVVHPPGPDRTPDDHEEQEEQDGAVSNAERGASGPTRGEDGTAHRDGLVPEQPDEPLAPDSPVRSDAVELQLPDYEEWPRRGLRDPRKVKIEEVIRTLEEIVGVEGPMVCARAYEVYAEAAGLPALGREVRSVLNHAVAAAVRLGILVQSDETGQPGQQDKVVRIPGRAAVVPRRLGPRCLEHVPPSEICEVARLSLLGTTEGTANRSDFVDRVLKAYEVTEASKRTVEWLKSVKCGPSGN